MGPEPPSRITTTITMTMTDEPEEDSSGAADALHLGDVKRGSGHVGQGDRVPGGSGSTLLDCASVQLHYSEFPQRPLLVLG